ncbi:hypothetical protein K488DRAFT_42113 [Vararia minispora EC-137]|uniref:Uncharacterized protein n=1 Tax=Vararia minispora EC-137 TaxID=1314806 RepID=A0ACB8QWL8_9AGAM|nr:hypothetical protein K488DRAFT_42113 [Vararia minispora EC-137]
MTDAIELDILHRSRAPASEDAPGCDSIVPSLEDNSRDSAAASWSWFTAGVLALWASVLILFPRFLLFAADESQPLTPLEAFLSLHFGIYLASLSVGTLFNIPAVEPVPAREQSDPPRHPLILSLSLASLLSAFLAYNTAGVGALSVLYAFSTGFVGVFGFWVITFSGTAAFSAKTGADKHTSAFIFGNKASASMQKKKWRKEQKARR